MISLYNSKPQLDNLYFDVSQLNESEIKQFIEDGYVIARNVFSRNLAKDIRTSFKEDIKEQNQNLNQDSLFLIHKKVYYNENISKIFTQKYIEIINELCGLGRWEFDKGIGYWFISYPDKNKSVWQPVQSAWHIDSNTKQHTLNSKLGLLAFHLFTDILPGGGGTAVRIGSHKYSARILEKAGAQGLSELDFSRQAVKTTSHLPFTEITGQCGDVLFMHPLTVHTRSSNILNRTRIVGHKFFHLFEPMNLNRQDFLENSPIETSIVKALE
ncbi:MAG TPA: hypothetical protein VLN45_07245 [Ignavibacteriaceae bacterium]|nr:hypothetical protein [Ignavibacteriaceae bacterium]